MIPLHDLPCCDLIGPLIAAMRLSPTAWDRGWHGLGAHEILAGGPGQLAARCKLHRGTQPVVELRRVVIGPLIWHGGQCGQCGSVLVFADPERRMDQ